MHDESDESEGSVPSGAPSPTAPARERAGQEQVSAGPEHLLTADALAVRASAMFDDDDDDDDARRCRRRLPPPLLGRCPCYPRPFP